MIAPAARPILRLRPADSVSAVRRKALVPSGSRALLAARLRRGGVPMAALRQHPGRVPTGCVPTRATSAQLSPPRLLCAQDEAARPRPSRPRPAHHAREAADLVRDLGGDMSTQQLALVDLASIALVSGTGPAIA